MNDRRPSAFLDELDAMEAHLATLGAQRPGIDTLRKVWELGFGALIIQDPLPLRVAHLLADCMIRVRDDENFRAHIFKKLKRRGAPKKIATWQEAARTHMAARALDEKKGSSSKLTKSRESQYLQTAEDALMSKSSMYRKVKAHRAVKSPKK